MTGLLGGAFDPPHVGHVALADAAQRELGLSKLVVIVVADPGHKDVHCPVETRLALAQAAFLRRDLHGVEGGKIVSALARILVASAVLAGVSYGIWYGLDDALGRSLVAQIVSLGVGIVTGLAVYVAVVLALRVEEARQIRQLIGGRLRRS